MSKFTPYYRGFISIGGLNIPVLPNATYSNPTNWSVPPIVGNLWQYDYGDGLRQPVLDCTFVIRNTAGEALGASLWDYLLFRSRDNSFDAPYIGAGGGPPAPLGVTPGSACPDGGSYGLGDSTDGISFWDGATGIQMTGAKAASFSLSCTKGDDIRLTVRFMGTGQRPINTVPGYAVASNPYSVLRFNRLYFGTQSTGTQSIGTLGGFSAFPTGVDGVRSGGAYSFSINYNNNLTPDLGMNGTVYPSGLNAGLQTVSVNYSIQANDTAIVDHFNSTGTSAKGNAIGIAKLQPATAGSFVPSTDLWAVLSLANLLDTSPDERAMSAPRVMRNHSLIALGGNATSLPPLAYICGAGEVEAGIAALPLSTT